MKAELKFDFEGENGIEDTSKFKMMMSAPDLYLAMNEFDSYLRSLYKHQNTETIGTYEVREKFHEILRERNINLDELM